MSIKRLLAATELVLVFPGALFMTALFVRNLQPQPYEPARTAQRLVVWFSGHPGFALNVCLIALPFAAVVLGGAAVSRIWGDEPEFRREARTVLAAVRANLATVLIAGATLAAGVILAIVVGHVLTD